MLKYFLLLQCSPCLLGALVSGLVSKNPSSFPHLLAHLCHGQQLPCVLQHSAQERKMHLAVKFPISDLSSQNSHLFVIASFNFPHYFLWLSCNLHLPLDIISHLLPLSCSLSSSCMFLSLLLFWVEGGGGTGELLSFTEHEWAGDTAVVRERIRKKLPSTLL